MLFIIIIYYPYYYYYDFILLFLLIIIIVSADLYHVSSYCPYVVTVFCKNVVVLFPVMNRMIIYGYTRGGVWWCAGS